MQSDTIENVKSLYNLRQRIIDLLNDNQELGLKPFTKQNRMKQIKNHRDRT